MQNFTVRRAKWATMDDAEREFEAIECRAEIGIVPYQLWASLTIESRIRLASLSQTDARKRLDEIARQRVTELAIAEAAMSDMLRGKT